MDPSTDNPPVSSTGAVQPHQRESMAEPMAMEPSSVPQHHGLPQQPPPPPLTQQGPAGAGEVIVGQFKATPSGGFATTRTTAGMMETAPSSHAAARTLAGEEKYPSVFTGGMGPEVMVGKWKMTRSCNFREYLEALGVNMVKRNMMDAESYCMQFEKIGEETWKVTTVTSMKRIELTFKLDEQEVEEFTDDGRRVLSKMNWENGVLTQRRYAQEEGEKDDVVVYIFKANDMELIAKVEDVICKRFFTRDEHCM